MLYNTNHILSKLYIKQIWFRTLQLNMGIYLWYQDTFYFFLQKKYYLVLFSII